MMRYSIPQPNARKRKPTTATVPTRGTLIRTVAVLIALIIAAPAMQAQISVYPPVLYSGMNVLTIRAANGLKQVSGLLAGQWRSMYTGMGAPYVRIASAPLFASCARQTTMSVFIMKTRPSRLFQLRVEDCKGDVTYFDFDDSEVWNLYREEFGNVIVGATACHEFRVDTRGNSIVIDSVASASPLCRIRYTNGKPPLRVSPGDSYVYDVCFHATKPGYTKTPILVYLRRRYPAGGYTNFIVADTAYVNVVNDPRRPNVPAPVQPRPPNRPRVLIAQPKPIILARPKPKPVVPRPPVVKPPVPKPDTVRVPPPIASIPARSVPVDPAPPPVAATAAHGDSLPIAFEEELIDPTTHRVVLMPTARSVDSGRYFITSYDVAGLLAGYGLDDRITVLLGGLYTPRFISYNLLVTAGVRYEFLRSGNVRAAAGFESNISESDLSSILLASPYAALSLGDDDQRITAAVAYTLRHHMPKDSTAPFDKQAIAAGLGGDYRFARHWKVAAEAYFLQDASYEPLVVTLRYFDRRFAIDLGLGVDLGLSGSADNALHVAPVVAGTWVW